MEKKQGFDLDSIRKKIWQKGVEATASKRQVFQFCNTILNVEGDIIIESQSPIIDDKSINRQLIFESIRRNGATNSLFLLEIKEEHDRSDCDGYFYCQGWIFWNDVKINYPSKEEYPCRFGGGPSAWSSALDSGIRELFKLVDEVRFILRFKKLASQKMHKFDIEFKPN